MSQNDLIFLESNFNNWYKTRGQGLKKVQPWLYYCVEQFVKPFALSDEDILYGITDGTGDGGVDALFFLINRSQLVQEDTDVDPRSVSRVHLLIIQVKSNNGFAMTEIDKLFFFTDDFLNLSQPASAFVAKYNPRILEIMRTFKEKYLVISGSFPTVSVEYIYITKGDESDPDQNAKNSADRVIKKAREHLNKAECNFRFVNAQALLRQVSIRPPRDKVLVWFEQPMQLAEGYVGLVKLREFYEFIQDEEHDLADRIFESNVRGYQQSTPVNAQIEQSLKTRTKANFWLLNNGVTIIAAKAQNAGQRRLALADPQIVNGLQTSREIFNYFRNNTSVDEDRSLLVRVIETDDPVVRDAVIKATNSQNKMPQASLRATDPIHQKIEELFKQYDLFYDRRKGFYRDEGRPIHQIVSVTELVQAVVSILLQRPDDARARPGNYFKDDARYEAVFGEDKFPLPVYLKCVQLLKWVGAHVALLVPEKGDERNLKFYVLFYFSCIWTGELTPSADRLLNLTLSEEDAAPLLSDCIERVKKKYESLALKTDKDTLARGPDLLARLRTDIRRRLKQKSRRKPKALVLKASDIK